MRNEKFNTSGTWPSRGITLPAIIVGDVWAGAPSTVATDDAYGQAYIWLHELATSLGGAVAIIASAPAKSIMANIRTGGCTVIGSYGAEIVTADGIQPFLPCPPLPDAAARLIDQFFAHVTGIEVRHYPEHSTVEVNEDAKLHEFVGGVMNQICGDMSETHYIIRTGSHWSLLPRGLDKGRALERLMDVAPFCDRAPFFIAGGFADLSALAAAENLGGGGRRVDPIRGANDFPGVIEIASFTSRFLNSIQSRSAVTGNSAILDTSAGESDRPGGPRVSQSGPG